MRGARESFQWLAVTLVGAWVFLAWTRILGPSDIYDKEQPRTIAYTADMLRNGFWILPHDTFGIPATKPPLYNWISAPFVAGFGYQEWALKVPSLLASVAVVWLVVLAARYLRGRGGEPAMASAVLLGRGEAGGPAMASAALLGRGEAGGPAMASAALLGRGEAGGPAMPSPALLGRGWAAFPAIAGLMYLANPMTAKLMYLARSDMVLVACLTGAWLAATMMVQARGGTGRMQAAYWLCTLGSALDKGPMVLLALAYLPLAAVLIGEGSDTNTARRAGRLNEAWGILWRSGWWWGLPLLLGCGAVFAWLAYRQEPVFFREVFLGREITGRMAGEHWYATVLHGPFYMVTRFLPWSLGVIAMLAIVPVRRWMRHPLAPAILWIFLILVVYSFARTKRPDRYAPVYPAMVLMAAWLLTFMASRWRVQAWHVAGLSVAMIVGLAVLNQVFSEPAKMHFGDRAIAFAEVRAATGGGPILFTDGELTPVETLLGQNQAAELSAAEVGRMHWCIGFDEAGSKPRLASAPLQQVGGGGIQSGRLAAVRCDAGRGAGGLSAGASWSEGLRGQHDRSARSAADEALEPVFADAPGGDAGGAVTSRGGLRLGLRLRLGLPLGFMLRGWLGKERMCRRFF